MVLQTTIISHEQVFRFTNNFRVAEECTAISLQHLDDVSALHIWYFPPYSSPTWPHTGTRRAWQHLDGKLKDNTRTRNAYRQITAGFGHHLAGAKAAFTGLWYHPHFGWTSSNLSRSVAFYTSHSLHLTQDALMCRSKLQRSPRYSSRSRRWLGPIDQRFHNPIQGFRRRFTNFREEEK